MKITSKSFENNKTIDVKFTKDGGNVSPHISWSDFPKETKSFALLCHDPDAPTQSGFWHWQIVNIPLNVNEIQEGETGNITFALEKNNDADMIGWYGPQPPKGHGKHRYVFTILALDVENIETTVEGSRAYTSFMLWSHTIDKAQITAYWENE